MSGKVVFFEKENMLRVWTDLWDVLWRVLSDKLTLGRIYSFILHENKNLGLFIMCKGVSSFQLQFQCWFKIFNNVLEFGC